MVSHAGARLFADLADATGLTGAFSQALGGLRQRRGEHDPGRIAVDVAVMLADGGEAVAEMVAATGDTGERWSSSLVGLACAEPPCRCWRSFGHSRSPMSARERWNTCTAPLPWPGGVFTGRQSAGD